LNFLNFFKLLALLLTFFAAYMIFLVTVELEKMSVPVPLLWSEVKLLAFELVMTLAALISFHLYSRIRVPARTGLRPHFSPRSWKYQAIGALMLNAILVIAFCQLLLILSTPQPIPADIQPYTYFKF